jgi:hypothetical protein
MAYYAPINQWISDFNWARFFDRTQDSGLPFLASQFPSNPTTLLPKAKPGIPFVIGPKEAQALADYLDATEPMACGGMTADELATSKAKARQEPISPMPPRVGGPPVIVTVKHLVRPKRDIRTYMPDHTATELEQHLALPEAPKGRRQ